MTLWIVRHGRTEANAKGLLLGRADPELDETGRRQAAQIAAALPAPDRLLASPLIRTTQTAEAFHAKIELDVDFIEMDYGDFDLRPLTSIPKDIWRRWQTDLDYCPPNGESMRQMIERVWAGLEGLASAAIESNIVVVSHVFPIKASLCWAMGTGPDSIWRSRVGQASITRIEVSETGPVLQGFNGVGHLE